MMFEQRRNRLTIHFSGRVPGVKRRISVVVACCDVSQERTASIFGVTKLVKLAEMVRSQSAPVSPYGIQSVCLDVKCF
jgi:hypothetical protein